MAFVKRMSTAFKSSPVVDIKKTIGGYVQGKLASKARQVGEYSKFYDLVLEDYEGVTFTMREGKDAEGAPIDRVLPEAEIKAGLVVSVIAPSLLHKALEQEEIGARVKITYLGQGKKKVGRHAPFLFDLEVDE